MSTTGMLWFAMLDMDRDIMLPVVLFELIPMTGLAALLVSKDITARLYVCCVVSC